MVIPRIGAPADGSYNSSHRDAGSHWPGDDTSAHPVGQVRHAMIRVSLVLSKMPHALIDDAMRPSAPAGLDLLQPAPIQSSVQALRSITRLLEDPRQQGGAELPAVGVRNRKAVVRLRPRSLAQPQVGNQAGEACSLPSGKGRFWRIGGDRHTVG